MFDPLFCQNAAMKKKNLDFALQELKNDICCMEEIKSMKLFGRHENLKYVKSLFVV